MPDFVGKKIQEVEEMTRGSLAGLQLTIERRDDQLSDLEAGVVTRQEPPAGTLIQPGTTVNLWLALGTVTVPDVRRQPLETARGILQANQLKLDATTIPSSGVDPNTVLSQSPVAGSRVPAGTTVQVTVADLTTVEVPDVTNRRRDEAEELLRAVGLSAQVTEEVRTDQATGIVQNQIPPPRQLVAVGTVIRLTVSSAPTESFSSLIWIIGVVGLTALLAGAGYLMRRSPNKPKGKGGNPQLSVRSKTEMPEDEIHFTDCLHSGYELRLRKIVDPGEQTIEPPGKLIPE
jgi:beta-lactam-binding protein with PASTA domain